MARGAAQPLRDALSAGEVDAPGVAYARRFAAGIVGVGMGWGYSTRARARTDRSNTSVAASRPCVVKGRERMR